MEKGPPLLLGPPERGTLTHKFFTVNGMRPFKADSRAVAAPK